mgnify:CR=1 FL=1
MSDNNYTTHFTPRKLHKLHSLTSLPSCNAVIHPITGETITNYKKVVNDPILKKTWEESMCKELGRLAQGIRDIKGSNCMKFTQQNQVPEGRKVTHARLAVDHRPGKSDPNRTRLTVGGNLLSFEGDLCTETTDSMSIKMSLNSALSTKGAKFMTVDMKNFCLGTPMDVHEHMKIKCDLMPQEIKKIQFARESHK